MTTRDGIPSSRSITEKGVRDFFRATSSDAVGKEAIIDHQPERSFDVRDIVLDISRLQSFLPYVPTDFATGLAATAAAYAEGIPQASPNR